MSARRRPASRTIPANDPVSARMISSGANATGRGGIAALAGAERNVRSAAEFERIQVTGGSLSFPVNALTGMFVGSDNPLYYIYSTFRGELAYMRNVGFRSAIHDGGITNAFQQRFMPLPLETAAKAQEMIGTPAALAEAAAIRADSRYNKEFLPG